MKNTKKTIFITIARGSLVRNFFHTGIIKKLLDAECKVVILTQNYQDDKIFGEYQHVNLKLEPLIETKKIIAEVFIRELLKGAAFNQTVRFLHKYRLLGTPPRRILYLPRLIFIAPLRFLPGFRRFIRWIDFKLNPQREHDYLFEKYKPDLVFSTCINGYTDSGVLKSAKRFGIKTVGMPKSWDNLSKILFNFKADYLIVWNQFMKVQAVRLQGYKGEEIVVTGVPQFDFYHKKDYLLDREDFCKCLGLDPRKKIILYGSTGGGKYLANEADYVELIQKFIMQGKIEGVQVLVRPHLGYIDDVEKFRHLESHRDFFVDRSDKQNLKFKDYWDPSLQHVVHLYNSLHHAAVCINIASTLTLDAVSCGIPVINIDFDIEKCEFDDSIRRFYSTDYISALMETKGSWHVKSVDEYLIALQAVLLQKNENAVDTHRIVDQFLFKNDGQTSERLSAFLLSLMKNN